jgi:hypothetical protein
VPGTQSFSTADSADIPVQYGAPADAVVPLSVDESIICFTSAIRRFISGPHKQSTSLLL